MIPFILVVITFILLFIYFISTYKYNYWTTKNIPFVKPLPILGNYGGYVLLKEYIGKTVQNLYNKFPNEDYFGAFYGTEPVLVLRAPEVVKLVMTKDYYYFSGREISKYTDREVFTRNMFFSGGDRWKVTRQNITPLFSSAKMKSMFYLIENAAHTFETMFDGYLDSRCEFEVRDVMSRYTISGVCSCVFGINTKTLEEPVNNPFQNIANVIFEPTTYRGFKNVARSVWPSLFYGIGLKAFPEKINDFFSELLLGIFKSREYKPSLRNDFVDLILAFHEKKYIIGDSLSNMVTGDNKKVDIEVDDPLLIAQCITFFAAGFETTASTLSFTLYEIAKNEEAQRKVHEEIDEYLRRHKNKIAYESLKELTYLEACVNEAMRMYPVLGVLTREVEDNYTFPSGLQLEKNMRVHIPVYALHMDPVHFPEPEKYKPERFLPENSKNITPYTYLPFGEGPRTCIGMRFAKMKMMPGLITILKKYWLELADGMPSKLELGCLSLVTQPTGKIHLKAQLRDGWENKNFNIN